MHQPRMHDRATTVRTHAHGASTHHLVAAELVKLRMNSIDRQPGRRTPSSADSDIYRDSYDERVAAAVADLRGSTGQFSWSPSQAYGPSQGHESLDERQRYKQDLEVEIGALKSEFWERLGTEGRD